MSNQIDLYLHGTLDGRICWGQGALESPKVPLPRSLVAVPKSVHSEPLLLAFMPGAFVAMAIGKAVDTEAMDLVPKVLPGIAIAISETNCNTTLEISNQWMNFSPMLLKLLLL